MNPADASDRHIPLHQIQGESRVFTLAEARELFPLIRRITEESYRELEPVRNRIQSLLPTSPELVRVEQAYEAIVTRWVGKMERLGVVVKGLWLVDFDTGDGYLCWRFPELQLGHYHGHDQGFDQRRSLSDVIEEFDPDWAHS